MLFDSHHYQEDLLSDGEHFPHRNFFYSLQGLNNWICRELLNHVTPLSDQDRISLHNN